MGRLCVAWSAGFLVTRSGGRLESCVFVLGHGPGTERWKGSQEMRKGGVHRVFFSLFVFERLSCMHGLRKKI